MTMQDHLNEYLCERFRVIRIILSLQTSSMMGENLRNSGATVYLVLYFTSTEEILRNESQAVMAKCHCLPKL